MVTVAHGPEGGFGQGAMLGDEGVHLRAGAERASGEIGEACGGVPGGFEQLPGMAALQRLQ